jgi:hypothetical protein
MRYIDRTWTQGHSSQSYILCDGGQAFIYSHLVIIAKFNMTIAQHKQSKAKMDFKFTHSLLRP